MGGIESVDRERFLTGRIPPPPNQVESLFETQVQKAHTPLLKL